ncbi:MAG: hypothetical protein ACJAZ0_000925 [Halioglobus sp.]|jgi:hypothetical protein
MAARLSGGRYLADIAIDAHSNTFSAAVTQPGSQSIPAYSDFSLQILSLPFQNNINAVFSNYTVERELGLFFI